MKQALVLVENIKISEIHFCSNFILETLLETFCLERWNIYLRGIIFVVTLIERLIDWWIEWLIIGLIGRLIDWLIIYWLIGLLDCWVYGLMDWWIVGLMDWWIDGLMDLWIDGLMDWWIDWLRLFRRHLCRPLRWPPRPTTTSTPTGSVSSTKQTTRIIF